MKHYYVTRNGELVELGFGEFKTPFNHDTCEDCARHATVNDKPSLTQQHFREEVDINTIVDRFLKTGEMKQIPLPPQFGDVSEMETDYHALQNRIAETNALFYKLPAALRASYQNDPGRWVEDVNARLQTGDLDPLRAMGLDIPRPNVEPPPAENGTQGTPAPGPANGAPQGAPTT